ncbi:MAG TPA: phosphate acyltransferase, partial [Candidatus Acidoferrum sp.]|nr:phosphate acyltransferase [Candidatus Acidoferrum sp.]
MNVVSQIKEKARAKHRRVVLPEGTEPRMIQATGKLLTEGIASVTLLGDRKDIERLGKEHHVDLGKAELIDPVQSPDYKSFVSEFMEIRKAKGITEADAKKAMASPLFFGAMLVRHDRADASVSGSVNTTGDVLRAAIQVIGLKQGITTVSSSFIMTIPKFRDTTDKVFMFGDCAVIPNPTV